jgi:hypothetical protein
MSTLQQLSMKSPGSEAGSIVRQYRYTIQQLERDISQIFVISASSRTVAFASNDAEVFMQSFNTIRDSILQYY